ncbi:S4 domain-containing protein [Desulfuromonas sp. DDH964]|uniref:RNA-binding S4 domain-containing protein n=1 Tax=Desulfuromonas sp. DDH964 TaxID=1823759 RepID=UPI00078E4BE3|nr:RNA-binding S4 domain-containing protein [Desulfuromonas sp. DDH964]AMV71766.1 S4 domain-containing protein [Desulfuromonas sp. DDH964]
MDEFSLQDHPWIELHNLLKVTGLCASGGEAKARIAAGEARVDGAVELRKRCKILAGQVVEFAGARVLVTL